MPEGRPCSCGRTGIGLPYAAGDCRLCWLAEHSNRYRKLWGLPMLPRRSKPRKAGEADRRARSVAGDGPGTELKRLLGMIGVIEIYSDESETGCKCNQRAREMNRRGVAWCEANPETILEWLREEAERRKLVFIPLAAGLVVKLAIRRARRKEKMKEVTKDG